MSDTRSRKFFEAMLAAARQPGLLEEFDRLNGTNLCMKGTTIDRHIDAATGRVSDDINKFIKFVEECVVDRLKPEEE